MLLPLPCLPDQLLRCVLDPPAAPPTAPAAVRGPTPGPQCKTAPVAKIERLNGAGEKYCCLGCRQSNREGCSVLSAPAVYKSIHASRKQTGKHNKCCIRTHLPAPVLLPRVRRVWTVQPAAAADPAGLACPDLPAGWPPPVRTGQKRDKQHHKTATQPPPSTAPFSAHYVCGAHKQKQHVQTQCRLSTNTIPAGQHQPPSKATNEPALSQPRCCCVVLPAAPGPFPTDTGNLQPPAQATQPLLRPQPPLQQRLPPRPLSWLLRLLLHPQLHAGRGDLACTDWPS